MSIPGATESEIIDVLISTGSWGAVLWEPLANLGHIVVVAGRDRKNPNSRPLGCYKL
ncbi:MAG: hypothetical protein GDA48_18920 [Hormoscilla sp. GM102CHS1]|nr:hypothetical protein [Hormoscilla sp. GM102CHS1]